MHGRKIQNLYTCFFRGTHTRTDNAHTNTGLSLHKMLLFMWVTRANQMWDEDLHLISSSETWHAETCPFVNYMMSSIFSNSKLSGSPCQDQHDAHYSALMCLRSQQNNREREKEKEWKELDSYLSDAPQVKLSSVLRSMLGSRSCGNSSSSSFPLPSSWVCVSASATGVRLWSGDSTSVWTTPLFPLVDFSASGLTFSLWTSAWQTQERLLIARGVSDLWLIIQLSVENEINHSHCEVCLRPLHKTIL